MRARRKAEDKEEKSAQICPLNSSRIRILKQDTGQCSNMVLIVPTTGNLKWYIANIDKTWLLKKAKAILKSIKTVIVHSLVYPKYKKRNYI